MKQKLKVVKVTVNGRKAYKLYNVETGALYRTIYRTMDSAKRKRQIMLNFFMKKV